MSPTPDLIVLPDWYMLGFWWVEVRANRRRGSFVRHQWFAWVRLDCEHPEGCTTWHVWTAHRWQSGMPWTARMVVWQKPMATVQKRVELMAEDARAYPGVPTSGRLDVLGGGQRLLEACSINPAVLPTWLRVVVIQRREVQAA